MKIKRLLFLGAAFLGLSGGAFSASADVVENYTETFDKVTVVPDHSCDIKYWTHWTTSSYSWNLPTYTNPQEGGHTDGYLQCGYNGYAASYLVTPKVEGAVTFWVKAYSTGVNIIVYDMTLNDDGTYTRGAQLLNLGSSDVSTDEWKQFSVECDETGKYLGFSLNYAMLDDFFAPKATLEDKKSMKLTSAQCEYGAVTGELDENNSITFTSNVTVTNNGTVDIKAGEFKLAVYVGDYSNDGFKAGESSMTQDIPAGEAVTEAVTFTCDMSELTNFSNYYYLRVKEDLFDSKINITAPSYAGGTYYSNLSVKFVPYLPEMAIYTTGSQAVKYGPQFGQIKPGVEVTMPFKVSNTAKKAPLTVTGITVDGAEFSLGSETAFTVAAGETKELTLKFKSSEAGLHTAAITVQTKELDDVTLTAKAMVIPEGTRIFTFDDNAGGFILGNNWTNAEVPELISKGEGDMALTNNGSSNTAVITPKMHFAEGEKLYFELASRTGSGEMSVYTSTDRLNWSERLLRVDRYSNDDEAKGTMQINMDAADGTTPLFGSHCVAMPEGDYFVVFNGYGVRLDNIAGGTVVSVPVDVYVTDSSIPESGTVNYGTTSTLSVRNMGDAIAEDGYTVELLIDGEIAATAKAVAMKNDETVTFEISYTPHAAGEFTACMRIKLGELEITTEEVTMTVAGESATNKYQVGTRNDYEFNNPISVLNEARDNYQSETVYKKSVLEAAGLTAGDRISKITFLGREYTAKYAGLKAQVYLANTTDERAPAVSDGFTSTDDMTLVMDGEITFDYSMGSYAWGELGFITLDTPFEYTGEGLRIVIYIDEKQNDAGVSYWGMDSSAGYNQCLFLGTYGMQLKPMPVTYFYTQLPVPAVSGKVTDSDTGAAIEGAKVELRSGDVVYDATTGADGRYELNVFQFSLPYTLTVSAPGYVTSTTEEVAVAEEGLTLNASLTHIKVNVSGSLKLRGQALAGATVGLTPATNETESEGDDEGEDKDAAEPAAQADGEETEVHDPLFTTSDEDGNFTIANLLPGESFILTVYSEEALPYQTSITLTEEDLELGEIVLSPAYVNVTGQVMEDTAPMSGVKVVLTPEEGEALEATTDEEGKFLIKTTALNTKHSLTIEHPDYLSFAQDVDVAEDHLDLGVLGMTSGLGDVNGLEGFSATGLTGEIALSSSRTCEVRIYTASGMLVKSLSNFSGTATVSGLSAGLYIVNNVKVLVK